MRVRLTVLSGSRRGERRVFADAAIVIGGDPSHALYLPELPASDPAARLERYGCTYTITAMQPSARLRVNGQVTEDALLKDGDLLTIGDAVTVRFATVPEPGDTCKPFPRIVRESARSAARLDGGPIARSLFFLRDLCHCTSCDATRRVKVLCLGTCVLVVAGSVLLGAVLVRANARAARDVVALSQQVAAGMMSRRQLEQQVAHLRQLEQERARSEARLGEVSQALEAARERLSRLERQTPTLLTAIEHARQGVAFILVGYALHEPRSGKPLRFVSVDADGVPQRDDSGAYLTSVDGEGPIVESFTTGSGFVLAGGRIATNRHIAEPWLGEGSVERARARGFEPRITTARAYFRDLAQPVELEVASVSGEADVAVMRAGRVPAGLTGLKLASADAPIRVGDLVIVVGYPTGIDAVLAKADDTVAQQLVETSGGNLLALADELARRHLISPLVTLGHVGDVQPTNIVYDAATTFGSSGGPVLNAAGEVIGVNYAGMTQFAGARFGVPIRFVHRLLALGRTAGTR
jgi:serine protease Do